MYLALIVIHERQLLATSNTDLSVTETGADFQIGYDLASGSFGNFQKMSVHPTFENLRDTLTYPRGHH